MSKSTVIHDRKYFLDRFEQVLVLSLYAALIERLLPDEISAANWYPILLLLSEGLVVVLLVIRRRADHLSTNIRDWVVGFAGTFLVLLVGTGGTALSVPTGAMLMMVGIVIHAGAKLSLRRSFGVIAADRGIKRHGLYTIVRHPMYAGYMLTHIGFLLISPSWWNLAIYCAAWILFVARIIAEERVLSANPLYCDYKSGVRFRLLPGVY